MIDTQPTSPLTFDEAEQVAIGIVQRWNGLTGQMVAPSVESVTDLVQRVLRDAAVIIAERGGRDEAE